MGKLEKGSDRNLMEFNKKSKALHLRRNPRHQDMLGASQVQSSSAGKDPGVLVDSKFSMNQHTTPTAEIPNGIFGYIRQSMASRSREVILALY